MECIILSVNDTYMDAQEVMHMTDYSKITALYSRLSVGDEDRDGGESNSMVHVQELPQRNMNLPESILIKRWGMLALLAVLIRILVANDG